MSNFTKFAAATDIAAAYSAVLSAGISGMHAAPAQRTRVTVVGRTTVFGNGHPPRGIPL
jgi:hypothetical protein